MLKNIFPPIIVIAVLCMMLLVASCSCKKTVVADLPITLVIEKVGTGSITASWAGGSATDEELVRGIQVMPNTEITLRATTDSANVLWAYANSLGNGKMLPLLMQQNTTVNVAFYNLSFVNRVTIKKVHGVGMVQGSWHGGSSTDAELTKELTVPKGTRLKITGISNSPKVVWNNDMQHPRDTISFFVLQDTVIEVGFYDPVVTVRKVHGTGTVSASWDAGAGRATDAELAGEVALPKGTQLTISGASASPKVVWNGNMQHPSKDVSFRVEKDTVIRVGFYDPIVKIEKIGGIGTVSGSWSNGKATDIELTRGIELPIGTQISFTPTTKYYHTAWTYGKDATKADTVNTSSLTITQDTTIKVNFFNIVYVAGYYTNALGNTVAALWKDGKLQILSDGSTNAKAYCIYLSGSDVYVGGDVQGRATIWKNGQADYLHSETDASGQRIIGRLLGLYVSGSDVYAMGGYTYYPATGNSPQAGLLPSDYGYKPTLWHNGKPQNLLVQYPEYAQGYATGIYIHNNDTQISISVLLSNFISTNTTASLVYQNGKVKPLYVGVEGTHSLANGIYVSDGNEYVAGTTNYRIATLWKDGKEESLEGAVNGVWSEGNSVYVWKGDVYIAGFIGDHAVMWKNRKLQPLGGLSHTSAANALYVDTNNEDIYLAGHIGNAVAIWKNQQLLQEILVDGGTDAVANAIWVQ